MTYLHIVSKAEITQAGGGTRFLTKQFRILFVLQTASLPLF